MALDALSNLIISVGGDISPLEDKLNEIPAAAQQAASELDAALAGGLQSATDGIQNLGAALNNIQSPPGLSELGSAIGGAGEAAGGAAPKLEELGQAEQHAGESAHEAEGSMKEMAETLVRLGEALLIAESLKEFATEALNAYDAVQKATISLTTLTGDAQQAGEMIERLKDLALSDALSFPDLLTAQTRMTALGLSAEQSAQLMEVAANAAATMNTSFGTVVNQIDRMVSSGGVLPRTLANIGTSADALAAVMGVATADITADFKLLDEPTRGEVLQQALQKTAGVAAQQAETISGQLKIIATSWELMSEEVGASLATALQPVVDFIRSDFLPAIGQLINTFGELPEPIRDFTIALVALGTAAGVTVAAIGAIGLVLAPVEPVLLAAGGAAVALGAGFTALLETSPDLQAAVKDLWGSLTELWATVEQLASPAIPELSGAIELLATAVAAPIEGLSKLVDFFNQMLTRAAQVADFFGTLLTPVTKLGDAFTGVHDAAERTQTIIMSFLATAAPGAVQLLAAINALLPATSSAAKGADEMAAGWNNAAAAAKDTSAAASDVTAKVQAQLAASQAAAAAEQAKLDAIKAANEALKSTQQQMDQASKLASTLATEIGKLPDSYERFVFTLGSGKDWLDKTDDTVTKLQGQLNTLVADQAKFWAAGTAASTQMGDGLANIIFQTSTEIEHLKEWRDAQGDITAEAAKLPPVLILTSSEMAAVKAATKDTSDGLTTLLGQLPQASTVISGMAPNTKAWDDAMKDLGITSNDVFNKSLGKDLKEIQGLFDSGRLSTDQLSQAWETLSGKFKNSLDGQREILATLQAEGAPLQLQLGVMENILNDAMKRAQYTDMTGASELVIAAKLTEVHALQWAISQDTMAWANAWNSAVKDVATAWGQVGQSMSQALITGQNVGQALIKTVEDLAQKILGDLIQGALNKLAAAIIKSSFDWNAVFGTGGAVDAGLQHATQAIGDWGSSVASDMADTSSAVTRDANLLKGEFQSLGSSVADSAQQMSSSTQQAAASIHASASSMVADFNLIATAVAAIASIFSAIELEHTNTLLSRIEESTRRMDITMEGAGVTAWQTIVDHLPNMDTTLMEIWPSVFNSEQLLEAISANTTAMLPILEEIAANGTGGGGGGGGSADDAAQKALQNGIGKILEQVGNASAMLGSIGTGGGGVSYSLGGDYSSGGSVSSGSTSTSGSPAAPNPGGIIGSLITQVEGAFGDLNSQSQSLAQEMQVLGVTSNMTAQQLITGYNQSMNPSSGPPAPTGSGITPGDQATQLLQQVEDRFAPDQWAQQFSDSLKMLGLSATGINFEQLPNLNQNLTNLSSFAGKTVDGLMTVAGDAIPHLTQAVYDASGALQSITDEGRDYTQVAGEIIAQEGALAGSLSTLTAAVQASSDAQDKAIADANTANLQLLADLNKGGPLSSADIARQAILQTPTNLASMYPADPYAGITTSAGGGVSVPVTVQAGMVIGAKGINQFADTVANTVMDRLRRSGLRF